MKARPAETPRVEFRLGQELRLLAEGLAQECLFVAQILNAAGQMGECYLAIARCPRINAELCDVLPHQLH